MSIASSNAQSPQAPLDLVVVDDDKLTLEIVSWICRGTTTRFRLFVDPEVAMEHLSHSLPSILIVDYYMPEQNGLEFIENLSRHCDLGASKVFLCSAIRPPQMQIDQLEALGTSVLDKSVICDKKALHALLDANAVVTGNKRVQHE